MTKVRVTQVATAKSILIRKRLLKEAGIDTGGEIDAGYKGL